MQFASEHDEWLVVDEELFDRAILTYLRQESCLRFAGHNDDQE